VVIQVFVEMSFELSIFVVTPTGIAVIVEVIPVPDASLRLDEDVGFGTSFSAGNSREVVLPSTRRILTRPGRLTERAMSWPCSVVELVLPDNEVP